MWLSETITAVTNSHIVSKTLLANISKVELACSGVASLVMFLCIVPGHE